MEQYDESGLREAYDLPKVHILNAITRCVASAAGKTRHVKQNPRRGGGFPDVQPALLLSPPFFCFRSLIHR
jgi:hypothetical protein